MPNIQDWLERELSRLLPHAPGASASITDAAETLAISAVGLRRSDGEDALTIHDPMHIGSCGKSLTAALVARAVDNGIIPWTAPIADRIDVEVDPRFAPITLVDLLSHRAGLPALEEAEEIDRVPDFPGGPAEQRMALTDHLLRAGPTGTIGEFRYSNAGFSIAMSVIEQLTGRQWEHELPALFDELDMDAGIGWPPRDGAWGHAEQGGRLVPVDPDGDYRLEAWLAVAGDVHATPQAMAIWLRENMAGMSGDSSLLSGPAWARLHGLGDTKAGLGWGRQQVRDREVSVHSGSAETFFTLVLIDHERRTGIDINLNAATQEAEAAAIPLLKAFMDSDLRGE